MAVSKEEYLKRYLSGAPQEEKKKKKKKKKSDNRDEKPAIVVPRMKIIDTDVDVPSAIHEAPETYTIGDDEGGDIEELPQIAAVEDHRDLKVQLDEEFKKSGKWKTFTEGIDIARKNLINEVIKIEQSDLKEEPMDEDELSDFLKSQKKKKIKVEVKEEPKSPPRKRQDSSDTSPPRRRRHDSSDDNSPPRRRHDSSESDNSPPRKRREDSDSDASPPRRKENGIKAEPDSDASPPRKRAGAESDSDASPPRRRAGAGSDSDMSPPRKGGGSDSDLSPPREPGKLMTKTLDGKKAGLQNAKDLKAELVKIKNKERKAMEELSHEVSGRYAKTKVRGRLLEKEAKEKEEKAKKEVPEEVKEKFKTWNKGMAQVKAAGERIESDLHEMSKPLTRGVEDEDREKHFKDVEHADDPMLAYMRKKKSKLEGKRKRMPQYEGPQPPMNRYNIPPGYRWDGVDRSNGFEKRLLTQGINKVAQEEEAYKWSTEDM